MIINCYHWWSTYIVSLNSCVTGGFPIVSLQVPPSLRGHHWSTTRRAEGNPAPLPAIWRYSDFSAIRSCWCLHVSAAFCVGEFSILWALMRVVILQETWARIIFATIFSVWFVPYLRILRSILDLGCRSQWSLVKDDYENPSRPPFWTPEAGHFPS